MSAVHNRTVTAIPNEVKRIKLALHVLCCNFGIDNDIGLYSAINNAFL